MPISPELTLSRIPTLLDAVESPEDLAEYSHFRHELPRSARPLTPIADYPQTALPVSTRSLLEWHGSAAYEAAFDAFRDYPERSLCREIDRVLLYHLVRSLRPEHVVEIGTYFAAGTEVLARALWECGTGTLHTADPYGKIRCPSLLARWEDRLRAHVRFYPWNSMELFQHLGERQTQLDLAFIDGNHDFEFALFDLQAASKLMRPGGVIVMDDANQSGPFWASKVFLDQNPGWSELGNCLALAKSNDPFGPVPTLFPGSKFLLLHAPREIHVGELPFSTGQVAFDGTQLTGLEFELPPQQHGEVQGRIFLRGFPTGERPEQIETLFRLSLRGETSATLRLKQPVRTRRAGDSPRPRQTVEVVLLWQPERGSESLKLIRPPTPLTTSALPTPD
ncbi:MAG: class I SAM-dependent methyltransferase [Planctomycetales bacterium]